MKGEVLCGVYAIENTATNKVYIGSSSNIHARFASHRHALRHGIHKNKHLQSSWKKHGEKAFVFHVIEIVSEERLLEKEQEWIDSFGDYNITGATRNLGTPWTKERREKQAHVMKQNPVWSKENPPPKWMIDRLHAGRDSYIKETGGSFLGMRHSDKTKARLSEASTGNKWCVGRVVSEETRKKIGEANSKPKNKSEQFIESARKTQREILCSKEVRKAVAVKQVGRKRSARCVAKMSNSARLRATCLREGIYGDIPTCFVDPISGDIINYTLNVKQPR
jgi:group I intron endonuclease